MSLTTMAVLLMAMMPPIASAVCHSNAHQSPNSQPSANDAPVVNTTVSTTCAVPSPKTKRFIARSLGKLNSSPMANIRNTTPNSAR
jgi:hypothetical protein